MPKIQQLNILDITPEKFLRSCSPEELIELDLLLGNNEYQSIINCTNDAAAVYKIKNLKEIKSKPLTALNAMDNVCVNMKVYSLMDLLFKLKNHPKETSFQIKGDALQWEYYDENKDFYFLRDNTFKKKILIEK